MDDEATADATSAYQIMTVLNCEKDAAESIEEAVTKALKNNKEVESITLSAQSASRLLLINC